ncbi:HNH endonuclease signature motif containing protein [Serinicoccus sediminis]|uniref:HNH endonuclease signature motif containing protein n=1 Tax=Serinicoccus sediminis TaxID=2306021 RepID=UPI00101EC324|nr:HNH endonuclease signature motif containing protein [Serinicoccus sediminis]
MEYFSGGERGGAGASLAEGASFVVDEGWGEALDELDAMGAADYQALMAEVCVALGEMHGHDGAGLPEEELAAGLDGASLSLGRAALGAGDVVMVQDEGLTAAIEAVGRLQTQLGAIGFRLAQQAAARGLHRESGMTLLDWLRVRCPWLSTQDASQVTAVVAASDAPAGAQIGEAVASGDVPLHRAATVARTMTRLQESLDPDQQESYTRIATAAAGRTDVSDKDLSTVCHRLIEDLLHEKAPGERERAAIALRGVTSRRIAPGLTRFTIDAPDGAAATINGVLTSQLAAPAPDETTQEPDPRTATQRRFDALTSVINRGISRPGAPPSTARATVILTIPFDPERGLPSGPATTADGGYVPPRQASEMACSAELTPVWMAADGEPLALGHKARYATPSQWLALVARDKGCSYPGCSALPQWCDSHHVDWWSRGGETDVSRMALLCGRHHTVVHQHDLSASVDGGTVTWHV